LGKKEEAEKELEREGGRQGATAGDETPRFALQTAPSLCSALQSS